MQSEIHEASDEDNVNTKVPQTNDPEKVSLSNYVDENETFSSARLILRVDSNEQGNNAEQPENCQSETTSELYPKINDPNETDNVGLDTTESHTLDSRGALNNNVQFSQQEVNQITEPEEEQSYDGASEHSFEIEGALDVYILEIPWETDINRRVDIQLGEEEWGTRFNKVEGGVRLETWESRILEIAKKDENEERDWNTAIRNMTEDEELHAEWSTTIAAQFENQEVPVDWGTTFNAIGKVDENKNKWTSALKKIEKHASSADAWSSRFNKISTEHANEQNDWQFKMPKRMTNLAVSTDWQTRFNKIEEARSVVGDTWESKFTDMLLQCDDRQSHWDTNFLDIEKHSEELNPWGTAFRDIAPSEEEEQWDSTFYGISEESDLPEHWQTTFKNIEKNEYDENEWLINMQDTPDSFRDPADWVSTFNLIQDYERNALWDTLFNEIGQSEEELYAWTSELYAADISGIERESWETNYNRIALDENTEFDWEVQVNAIRDERPVEDD